ncbi:Phosphoserine phosphatase RsbU [Phycisphaerae bacterium RAS2]|nr:Phosphoserine phosphatase RsbU [Phycisphaerae bacterium RAS2]
MSDQDHPTLTEFVDRAALEALAESFRALTGHEVRFCDSTGHCITGAETPPRSSTELSAAGRSRSVSTGTAVVDVSDARALDNASFEAVIDVQGVCVGKVQVAGVTDSSDAARFVRDLAATIEQLCHHAQQLRRRVDELAALYEVSAMLSGNAALQDVLDMATRQLVDAMELKACSLRLLDPDTGELKIASVANLSERYLSKGPVRVRGSSIDQAALSGETVHVEDMRTDPRTVYKKNAKEEGLISALVTRVASRGKAIGALRAYKGTPHRFSPFEVSLLEAIAAQLGAVIANARLMLDARKKEHLARQVKLAAEVQRRMIPAYSPQTDRYQFGCDYQPSQELGGDFYDFIRFDNGDIGAVVADVVGKGVPASLMMASARSTLRSNARRVTDMGEIIKSVNRRLFHDTLPGEFATAFYVELAADGRLLKYCNAGHEPMLLLRGGRIRELDAGGLALGIDPNETYATAEEALEPGDLMLMFTDGLLEARNFDGEAYGRARIHESFLRQASAGDAPPVDVIAKQIFWDMRRFVGFAPVEDDVTLVVVRVI